MALGLERWSAQTGECNGRNTLYAWYETLCCMDAAIIVLAESRRRACHHVMITLYPSHPQSRPRTRRMGQGATAAPSTVFAMSPLLKHARRCHHHARHRPPPGTVPLTHLALRIRRWLRTRAPSPHRTAQRERRQRLPRSLLQPIFKLDPTSYITSTAVSSNGSYLAFGDAVGTIHLLTVAGESSEPFFNGFQGQPVEWARTTPRNKLVRFHTFQLDRHALLHEPPSFFFC